MSSLYPRSNYFQFARYFHFAEPMPSGVTVAYEDTTQPDDELGFAAEALRAAEVEAVRSEGTVDSLSPVDAFDSMKLTAADLDAMSIDEVREVARVLDIPERSKITDKAELVEEILRRM